MVTYSIIIPIYNAERYLPACLDSVLAQDTSSEYEVILVDDGSTDQSGRICDEYGSVHSNFCVIHTENRGQSAARNTGMRKAKGLYILFLDADDLWSSDCLSMLDEFIREQPDMMTFSACRFSAVPGDGNEIHQALLPEGEQGRAWLNKLSQLQAMPRPYPCIYAYRRAFLAEFQFFFQEDLQTAEDFEFNMRCLSTAQSIVGTDRVLLHYRKTEGSLTSSLTTKKLLDNLTVSEQIFRKFPNAAVANHYCSVAVNLAGLRKQADRQGAISFVQDNWDIWRYTSYRPYKMARFLFRFLGCCNGAAVYAFFQTLWHRHGKTGALMKRR